MTGAPLPPDEYRRLLDLARYQILDSAPEEEFDRITRLAARVLRVPVAVLNFVDERRQWGKAMVGLESSEAPREHSFCAWTILEDGPFVVQDAPADPRFRDNPMVTGAPHVHLYAGAPLVTPAGQRIGTLCVTDDQPHPLDAQDLQALQDLAALAMQALELRRQALDAQRTADALQAEADDLRRTLAQARILEDVSGLMDLELDPAAATLRAAGLISAATEADYAFLLSWPAETYTIQAAYQRPGLGGDPQAIARTLPTLGGVTAGLRDRQAPLYLTDYGAHPQAIASTVDQVAWLPLGGEERAMLMVVRLHGHAVRTWRAADRALLEAAGRTIRYALNRHAVLTGAQRQARQDALTGLPNRRAFDEAHAELGASGQAYTLAVIDLDGLKAVNDREGHAQGDRLLQAFGQALGAQASGGVAYRLGGDEFAVLGAGMHEAELHGRIARAVQAAQAVTAQPAGASAGVAHSGEATGPGTLLALADGRMYATKRRRKSDLQPGR
ncbi:sensor domain-containing diguanylate cyclase [Deinococcus ficus]|uniref:sensor domain-containing diguanylate cyclase n=1 Tax=Deinococcus ficus TaxID=317577 RepID=UPI0003B639B6|nr:sensor domain-containing diguanylate cyclase [Deinococcus ficus]